ncbi:hypothetical protein JCM1841_000592 [Sporobolomyces salmonicolor]
MSKSPKALLPSSLSFSSISRAANRPHSNPSAATTYSRRTFVAGNPAGGPPGKRGCVVVRQRRASSPQSATAPRSTPKDGSGLLRSNSSAGAAPPKGLIGYLEAPSTSRGFHTSSRPQHQQAIPASSGGIPPPPGSAPPSSPSSSAGDGSPFSPKQHASLATPSHDGPLLLGPHSSQSSNGPSLSLHAGESSSSTTASTSQTQQGSSSSNPPPATLFSHPPPSHIPSHALPSFFGSALSIARRSNLSFRNGAYGIPKAGGPHDRVSAKGKEKMPDLDESEHYLSVGVGEDAYFLRADSLGVADGVGGWSGHAGANPARWSRKFMHHCSAELARYENIDDELFLQYYEIDPVDVLQRAFEKSLAECKDEGVIGSSTALLAVLRNDELRLANLGDCSCCVIRGDEYIFRTEEQQHSFNFPYQAGTNSKDTPAKDAQRFTVKVKKDDIVILASDGLVDNVFSDDLLEEVLRFVSTSPAPSSPAPSSSPTPQKRYTLNRFSPQAVSEALCFRAKSVYDDPRAVASPFQNRAVEEGLYYAGGKKDDVTCLIGLVGELEAPSNRRDVL